MNYLILIAPILLSTLSKSIELKSSCNYNKEQLTNCIKSLHDIRMHPFISSSCCFTRICENRCIFKEIVAKFPETRALYVTLCKDKALLLKESLLGCKVSIHKAMEYAKNDFVIPRNRAKRRLKNKIIELSGISNRPKKAHIRKEEPSRSTELQQVQKGNPQNVDKEITSENSTVTVGGVKVSRLQFLDIPKGNGLHIHDLRLEEEYLPFRIFSTIIGYLQPTGFPLGFLKSLVQNNVPFYQLTFQILKFEIILILVIIVWTAFILTLIVYISYHLCCRSRDIHRLTEESSETSNDYGERCTKLTLGVLMHSLLILFLISIVIIIAANSQISRAISKSTTVANVVFNDLETFIRNVHMQVTFAATSSTDITMEEIRKDLEETELLLGMPFQKELIRETGINEAMEQLESLKKSVAKVSYLVSDIAKECALAQEAGNSLQEQMDEISRQLSTVRQQCSFKDRSLCYTLQTTGFEVIFTANMIMSEPNMQQLERLSKENNFNVSIEHTQRIYCDIPSMVTTETTSSLSEIKNLLSKKRSEVYKSAHNLDQLGRNLTHTLSQSKDLVVKLSENVVEKEYWRWTFILGISAAFVTAWFLFFFGAPCGCPFSKSDRILIMALWICLLIIPIMYIMGGVALIMGTHGISLVCRPLWDHPKYELLTEIIDAGEIFYNGSNIINNLLNRNESTEIKHILRKCQLNQASYDVFNLNYYLNINTVTNYNSWQDLGNLLDSFNIIKSQLEILTPTLHLNLQTLQTIITVNLTKHRSALSGPITKRDLNSVADQMSSIARQLIDIDIAKRIDNLAFLTRRTAQRERKQLAVLREDILYKLASLELQLGPLRKEVNETITHLRNIQHFLDTKLFEVNHKVAKNFTARIEQNLQILFDYLEYQLHNEIGNCKPIWDVFHLTRFYFCTLIIDPINGLAVSFYVLIVIIAGLAPTTLRMNRRYNINEEFNYLPERQSQESTNDHGPHFWSSSSSRESETVDQPLWTSPSPTNHNSSDESHHVPPPPRLSTISSRITSPRVPQLPSLSRARSPRRSRHELLNLIEPIKWKTGAFSPRSWL